MPFLDLLIIAVFIMAVLFILMTLLGVIWFLSVIVAVVRMRHQEEELAKRVNEAMINGRARRQAPPRPPESDNPSVNVRDYPRRWE